MQTYIVIKAVGAQFLRAHGFYVAENLIRAEIVAKLISDKPKQAK